MEGLNQRPGGETICQKWSLCLAGGDSASGIREAMTDGVELWSFCRPKEEEKRRVRVLIFAAGFLWVRKEKKKEEDRKEQDSGLYESNDLVRWWIGEWCW